MAGILPIAAGLGGGAAAGGGLGGLFSSLLGPGLLGAAGSGAFGGKGPNVSQFPPSFLNASTLSPAQQGIEGQLGEVLEGLLGGGGEFGDLQSKLLKQLEGGGNQRRADRALSEILRGKPTDTEDFFRKAILAPSLRAFDQEIRPRIDQGFARHGASFSTRRGTEVGRQLGNVQAGAQGQLAALQTQMLESAKRRQLAAVGIPLQQTLGQIGGLSSLSGLGVNPSLSFLRNRSTENILGPAFATPGGGTQALGLLGQLFGGGGFGGGGGGGGLFGGLGKIFGK